MTLAVIIVTVLVQGFSAGWITRRLGVGEPAPNGPLILGAHPLARLIGAALKEQGLAVMLVDSSWDHARAARMQGLPVYYGSPVSPYADQALDLTGLGCLLAMSGRPHLDALAAMRFRREFGIDRVYELRSAPLQSGMSSGQALERIHGVADQHRGRRMFSEDTSLEELSFRVLRGAEIRATGLTEAFGMEEYQARNRGLLLFAIDAAGRLHVCSPDQELHAGAGWKLISLCWDDAGGATPGNG